MKISVHNLEFNYNGTPVLKNVTSYIEKGDFVALVGPNGSGKSTLIKCLNGILKAKRGSIMIEDRKIDSILASELAKQMAYVPQNEYKKPVFTVFDMVLLGRKPYFNWKPGKNDIDVTHQILKTLHLESIAMKEVNKLSGGQQQTVIIARALAQEPEILLLDEPTANLDIKHQIEVLELLKSLSQKGMTIIVALHDINMAIRYTNKLMMLKEGKIFASGGMDIITDENIEALYDVKVNIFKQGENIFILPFGNNQDIVKTNNT